MRWGARGSLLLSVLAFGCGGAAKEPATPDAEADRLILGASLDASGGGIDAAGLLSTGSEAALSEGATPLQVVGAEAATEGDRVGGFVEVGPKVCLVAYARGTQNVEDIDVLAFDDRGESLLADQSVSSSPAIVLCPPHPERVYVVARVSAGTGLVALGAHGIAPERAGAVAIKLGARMSAGTSRLQDQEAWPGLDRRVEQRRNELSGRWVELRRVSVPVTPGAASFVSAPLPGGRCMDVLVVPNEEARGLQVTLMDDRGTTIARGSDRGEARVGLVCSPVDTTITVGVRPRRGHGLAAVVLSRSEKGAEAELAVRPDARRVGPMEPLASVSSRVSAMLRQAKYGAPKEVGRGGLRMGKTVLHRHRMAPGCTRFDTMAGSPVSGLRAALWQGDVLVGRVEGGESVALFGCVERPTDVEIEVESQGPPGQYVVEARRESESADELRSHPIAAGRLLGRVNAGGKVVAASAVGGLQVVDVDQDGRGTYAATVAVGSCRTVVASLGPGAKGVDLQAVDLASREVVARGHGGTVATLRLCGGATPLRAEVRLSVGVGATRALVGVVDE